MYGEDVVSGVVIKSAPVGEADRRLELLTKERGKMVVFSRGCRRPTSPLVAFSRPFCFAKFRITSGKNNYLKEAEAIDYFDDITKDYETLVYATYFLEYAAYFSQEELENAQLLNLLYLSLKALLNPKLDHKLVRFIYEYRMLVVNGEAPDIGACFNCGKELSEEAWFHMGRRACFCRECASAAAAERKLSATARYTLQYVTYSPMTKLFAFTLTPEVQQEIRTFWKGYKKHYLQAHFTSLEMLPPGSDV